MPSRKSARKVALQLLYQNDTAGCSIDDTLTLLDSWPLGKIKVDEAGAQYVREVVTGTVEHKDEIDSMLREISEHWKFERVGVTEKNLLRLAVYEMMYRPDVPARVAINEAVNLTKSFGDEGSSGFINGILDAVLQKINEKPSS